MVDPASRLPSKRHLRPVAGTKTYQRRTLRSAGADFLGFPKPSTRRASQAARHNPSQGGDDGESLWKNWLLRGQYSHLPTRGCHRRIRLLGRYGGQPPDCTPRLWRTTTHGGGRALWQSHDCPREPGPPRRRDPPLTPLPRPCPGARPHTAGGEIATSKQFSRPPPPLFPFFRSLVGCAPRDDASTGRHLSTILKIRLNLIL